MHPNVRKFYLLFIFLSMPALARDENKSPLRLSIYKELKTSLPSVAALGLFEDLTPGRYKVLSLSPRHASFQRDSWNNETQEGGQKSISFRDFLTKRFSPCFRQLGPWCQSIEQQLGVGWQAIQSDGQGLTVLMQTPSGLVLGLDAIDEPAGWIRLDHGELGKTFRVGTNIKDAKPRLGRSLLLLQKGHLLVGLAGKPAMLVEFGPKGDEVIGVRESSFLSRVQGFSWPKLPSQGENIYEPLRTWEIEGWESCELTAIAYDTRAKKLFGLSGDCRKIVELSPWQEGKDVEKLRIINSLEIPKRVHHPSAMVVLPDGKWLVATATTKKEVANLLVLHQISRKK